MSGNGAALDPPLMASPELGISGIVASGGGMREIDQGQLLASIAATSHDCILSLDTEGTILWASPATEGILGWRPEDLGGSHVSIAFPRNGAELRLAALERLHAGERVEPFVDVGVRRDGSWFRAEVTLGPVHGAEGRVIGTTVILRDVTAQLQAIAMSARELAKVGGVDDDVDSGRAVPKNLSEVLGMRSWDSAVVVGADLTIRHVTGPVAEMLGYRRRDVIDHIALEYLHPADVASAHELVERMLAEPRRAERAVLRVRDKQQRWRWVEATAANCLADPEIGGIVANLRDITEQVQTDEALRLSEALHRAMVETAQEGIVATSPDGATIFANETTAQILGRPVESVYGEDPLDLLGLAAVPGDSWRREVAHTRPDGVERILEVSRTPLATESGELGALLMLSDVTDARRAESALRRQALHDPLTGLPNRYLFLDRLETAAARQRRSAGPGTAVLFLDLDGFKPVNDRYGHAVGDEVLKAVASRLLRVVRATDTVGRLGGDEFAIVCEDADQGAAVSVARRILDAFRRPVPAAGEEHPLGVSIGVALSPPVPFEELVRRADDAMYQAKQLGGGRIAVAGENGTQDGTEPTA